PVPTDGPTADGATVSAGWSDRMASVNRFSPETVSIKAGQTVTWKDHSDWMPHTVSFEPPFKSAVEKNAFAPLGTKSGGRFAGGVAHSGAIGPPAEASSDTFSLVFTRPGKYPYLCLLHAGMAGTVEVS
ncbi:MAG TPA: plastocyanin/azurin family copper-binding protein, partial [Gemmatimonadales bacterium]|nr:plastocyanin/azurin family copper-binding protein [Gemmatimonadales bacterium]